MKFFSGFSIFEVFSVFWNMIISTFFPVIHIYCDPFKTLEDPMRTRLGKEIFEEITGTSFQERKFHIRAAYSQERALR